MRVYTSELVMPVAPLGPDNPLAPLGEPRLVTIPVDLSAADPEMARNLGYGRPRTILPYTVQDGYTRNLVDTAVRTAVVDNGLIRAEFLLDYGGRMWSLYDHRHRRELLHRNPILQPANLALRNAWFAGGVEWNLGTTGHHPLTCAPLHAARVARPDGVDMLRLWEFERMRELVYQLDIYASPGSARLCVTVRITNPHTHEVPVYWWSNMAVARTEGMRVLAPARTAWQLGHDGVLRKVAAPSSVDFPHAVDYFYEIPDGQRPWIAALDAGGTGLLHASSPRLRGRKLFGWGTSSGGQRWQEWLSPSGHPYLEIQAGLARTQLEHLPIPAGTSWSWTETYGLIDSASGVADINERLDPIPRFEPDWADLPPTQRLHKGSGWGALDGPRLPGTPFADDTLGRDQVPWQALRETGTMPAPAPRLAPASYQVGPVWLRRLETADPHNWFTLLHLGVARWQHGRRRAAVRAWEQSHVASPNPWALRNLAFAEPSSAVDRLRAAHAMVPGVRAIAIEAVRAMLTAGKPEDALTFIDRLIPALRQHGRIRLLDCRAALDAGRLDRAARIADTGIVVDDIREGEDSLADLWFTYHSRRGTTPLPPLPCWYDFSTGAQ